MKIIFSLALLVIGLWGLDYQERKNKLLGIYGMYDKTSSDAKLNIAGFTPQAHDLNEKHYGLGIKLGFLLSPSHRITTQLEHHFKTNGFLYRLFLLGYEFTPPLPNTNSWRGVLGIHAGLGMAHFDAGSFVVNESAMGELNYLGFTYGLKAGLIKQSNIGEFEFSLQTKRLNFGEEASSVIVNNVSTQTTLNLSKTSNLGLYVGYNYLF